jgi:hypothetical protein
VFVTRKRLALDRAISFLPSSACAIVLSTHSVLTRWASRISSVGCTPREAITITSLGRLLAATSPSSRGVQSRVLLARSAEKPLQPRTINHRLSVLASYFEYCIRRDTEDGRGPWKGRINQASGNPLTEELSHGMIGRDLPARQRQRDGFRRRIPRTLPKVLEPTAIQKLIDSAGAFV